MRKSSILFKTAMHEAAHFVLNNYLVPNNVIDRITIIKVKNSLGTVRGEDISGYERISSSLISKEISILYAGYMAEVYLCNQKKKIARLHACGDLEQIKYWTKQTGFIGERKKNFRFKARLRSKKLVLKFKSQIYTLASQLMIKKVITGEEALLIILTSKGEREAVIALEQYRLLAYSSI